MEEALTQLEIVALVFSVFFTVGAIALAVYAIWIRVKACRKPIGKEDEGQNDNSGSSQMSEESMNTVEVNPNDVKINIDEVQSSFQIENGVSEPELAKCSICRESTMNGMLSSAPCGHAAHFACLDDACEKGIFFCCPSCLANKTGT